jgi:integrase
MSELVRLRTRTNRKGDGFVFMLDYLDLEGKRRRESLGHADKRKAKRQCSQKEHDLKYGVCYPDSMRLKAFLDDSFQRTGNQIRQSTQTGYRQAMNQFIKLVGNIDIASVTLRHGERFRQACCDANNSDWTVSKKIRAIKRIFQLAVERGQLEANPFQFLKKPRCRKKKVIIFDDGEYERLLLNAKDQINSHCVNWQLLIGFALETGMRKSELLNLTWWNIDFAAKTATVSPKKNSKNTWEWHVKDCDERVLPLSDAALKLLAKHQEGQDEGCPYVFIPSSRYRHIQKLRKQGQWDYEDSRLSILRNFNRDFGILRSLSGISDKKRFHDLRATAINNWFRSGLSLEDVRRLAGHASITTTQEFYLAVADGLVDRARDANAETVSSILAHIWHAGPNHVTTPKRGAITNDCCSNT